MQPLHKGRFGASMNSADLFFLKRYKISSLGGSKYNAGIMLGQYVASFVERFVILHVWESPPSKVSLYHGIAG